MHAFVQFTYPPFVAGAEDAPIWTSSHVLSMEELTKSLDIERNRGEVSRRGRFSHPPWRHA
jgi:hypothetical protein